MKTVKVNEFGLICPNCGNQNLHLGKGLPYNEGYIISITCCEHCDFTGFIYIYFHEGSIYIEYLD